MSDDLFSAAAQTRLEGRSPLAARLRPRGLDDVVGQRHLLAQGKPLRALIDGDRLSSVILHGETVSFLSFDIKDGYHFLEIEKKFQCYFGMNIQGRHYQCSTLPFGCCRGLHGQRACMRRLR